MFDSVVEGGKGCSRNITGARELRGGIIPSCGASENFCQNLRSIIFIYRMTLIKELVSEDHHPPQSPPPPPFLYLFLKQLTLETILHYPVVGSEIVGSVKLRKHEHKNKAGGNRGGELSLFPATAPIFQITRSYFCVPFTYASSILSDSLKQTDFL